MLRLGTLQYNSSTVLTSQRPEEFTEDERAKLTPYFTNTDRHVFALTNLPKRRKKQRV